MDKFLSDLEKRYAIKLEPEQAKSILRLFYSDVQVAIIENFSGGMNLNLMICTYRMPAGTIHNLYRESLYKVYDFYKNARI